MQYGLVAIAALCTVCAPVSAQNHVPDSLSVEEMVHLVLSTHPAIQGAMEYVAASEARVLGAESAFYPTVDALGSYRRVGPTPSIDVGGGQSFRLFPANYYLASVGVRHTLYDFGKRDTRTELARTHVESAGETMDLEEMGLAYGTIETFYVTLYLRESLQIQQDNVAALGQHLSAVRSKVAAGTATEFDVLTTEVGIARAQNLVVDIANLLDKRRIALRDLLGAPADAPLGLKGTLTVTPVDLDRDTLIAAALAQRPEIRLSRTAQAGAELNLRLSELGKRPSVSLDVSVGAKNGYQPNLNTLKANFAAGVAVDFPLFDGFRSRSMVAASDADLSAAQAQTEDIERQITTEVEQAIADLRTSTEKIGIAELQVSQAEQALGLAQTRYAAGVITNLDVLDVQTTLAEARLMETKARLDFVLSRYALARAVGDRSW